MLMMLASPEAASRLECGQRRAGGFEGGRDAALIRAGEILRRQGVEAFHLHRHGIVHQHVEARTRRQESGERGH